MFRTASLLTIEHALHPISLAGDAGEDLGEGMGGGIGTDRARQMASDIFPITAAVLSLHHIIRHAQLIGNADSRTGEGETEFTTADGRDGHAIALEIVTGLNTIGLGQGSICD